MDPTVPSFNPFDFGDPTANPANAGAPPLPQTLPKPPLPEQVAGFLGSKNVTPEAFLANPLAFLPKVGGGTSGPAFGGSLEPQAPAPAPAAAPSTGGVPLPQPRPASAPQAAAPPAPGAGLGSALAGLKAPAAPTPQTVHTPNPQVPGPHGAIKGGNLIALLAALGGQVPTAKVPLALGPQIGAR